ncbi:MAG TPA: efflux RND transporter periplasmic adaptor subunit [Gammaproteobacteria bacterium]|nr:efflux RND transporter periplasmic adaptor subunit [Gammaproteobacteria bacterium]
MMHRKRTAALVLAALIVAAAGAAGGWAWWHRNGAGRGDLTLYGNMDIRQVQLAFKGPERIVELNVREGDRVRRGQMLARQDTAELKSNLAYARAEVAAQRSVLAALEAGSRPQEIHKAEADVRAARARARLARLRETRTRKLFRKGMVSRQEYDDARAAAQSAEARLDAAGQALQLLRAGPRSEDIDAARSRLQAYQAQMDLAAERLKDATLRSPGNGVIENRILEVGDMASAQTPVYTLALTGDMWARTYVDEAALGRVYPGMAARVTSDSYPDRHYAGVVGYISPTAEFTPKSVETPEVRTSLVYELRVNICGPHDGLRLGMPVTVTLRPGTAGSASCNGRQDRNAR